MITDPSVAQTKQLAQDVLVAADLETLPVARVRAPLIRKLQRKFTLGRGAVPITLASLISEFLLYDLFERAYRVSLVVTEIDPLTWDIDYNYIRRIIHHTAYVAHRGGYLAEAAALQPFLRMPADYEPTPGLIQGLALRRPFEKWDLWNAQPVDMTSTIAGEGLADLGTLSTMWLFGGSREWPRERIDALYDSTAEQIKQLPGWAQW